MSVTLTSGGSGVDEQEFNAEIGRRVRAARGQAGLTQEALARQSGLTRGSVTNIESGVQVPPPYRLARLAAALAIEPARLLPSLDDPSPTQGLPAHLADAVAAVASAAQGMRDRDGQG